MEAQLPKYKIFWNNSSDEKSTRLRFIQWETNNRRKVEGRTKRDIWAGSCRIRVSLSLLSSPRLKRWLALANGAATPFMLAVPHERAPKWEAHETVHLQGSIYSARSDLHASPPSHNDPPPSPPPILSPPFEKDTVPCPFTVNGTYFDAYDVKDRFGHKVLRMGPRIS